MGQVMMSCFYQDPELLGEPSLEEMFAEPIIRLIMERDGVNHIDLRGEIDRVQESYRTLDRAQ